MLDDHLTIRRGILLRLEGATDAESKARIIIADLVETFEGYVPRANCSCHICPPCSDCVDHGYEREALALAKAFLKGTSNEKV